MSSQVFSIPKDGDFTTSLEHLCQCLATLTAFDLKMGFSTLALLAFLWEESGSIFLPFCHQLFIGEVPLSLLLSRLGTPCFLSFLPACQVLQSFPHLLGRTLSGKSSSWEPSPGRMGTGLSQQCWWAGRQPCALRTRCWLLLSFGSNRSPKAFSAELLPSQLAPSPSCLRGTGLPFPFFVGHPGIPPGPLLPLRGSSSIWWHSLTSPFAQCVPLHRVLCSFSPAINKYNTWPLHRKKSLGRRRLELELQFQDLGQN